MNTLTALSSPKADNAIIIIILSNADFFFVPVYRMTTRWWVKYQIIKFHFDALSFHSTSSAAMMDQSRPSKFVSGELAYFQTGNIWKNSTIVKTFAICRLVIEMGLWNWTIPFEEDIILNVSLWELMRMPILLVQPHLRHRGWWHRESNGTRCRIKNHFPSLGRCDNFHSCYWDKEDVLSRESFKKKRRRLEERTTYQTVAPTNRTRSMHPFASRTNCNGKWRICCIPLRRH